MTKINFHSFVVLFTSSLLIFFLCTIYMFLIFWEIISIVTILNNGLFETWHHPPLSPSSPLPTPNPWSDWSKFGATGLAAPALVFIDWCQITRRGSRSVQIQLLMSSNFQSVQKYTHLLINPQLYQLYSVTILPSKSLLADPSHSLCPWSFYELLYELNFPINPTFVSLPRRCQIILRKMYFASHRLRMLLIWVQLWYLIAGDVWGVDI